MAMIDNLEIKQIKYLTEKELHKVDKFILKTSTTGEFINTLNYLSYHPQERFRNDSVVVVDRGSGEIKGVMIAAKTAEGEIISYPGTTFAGPIIDRTDSLEVAEKVMDLILEYYESRYNKIVIKKVPDYYTKQPFQLIDYILLRRGYFYGMSAMANVINISKITSEDDIFAMFDSKRRNQVRKAVKGGRFAFITEDGIRDAVWENMNRTLMSKFDVKPTHTLQEIKKLEEFCPEHIKTYYVDTTEGEYGAFALVFLFKNVFHTQYLDVNYRCTGQYPNLLLIFDLIKEARGKEYQYFSFGASTEEDGKILNRGLYHYKAGYGGGDILLPVYTKINTMQAAQDRINIAGNKGVS